MKGIYVGALFGTIFSIIAIGIPVTNAYSIPGIDEPYDPPNYYSLTTISVPDSAPSPFALRELLSGQGDQSKIQKKSASNILSFLPSPDTLQQIQYALDVAKILRDMDDGTKTEADLKRYINQNIVPEIKKNTTALGLGANEQQLFNQMIDSAFDLNGNNLDEFAKRLAASEIKNNGSALGLGTNEQILFNQMIDAALNNNNLEKVKREIAVSELRKNIGTLGLGANEQALLNQMVDVTLNNGDLEKFATDTAISELKKNVGTLGLGANEQQLFNQMLDATLNGNIENFAKNTAESVIKDYLNKELSKQSNKYATILIGGCINGNGNINIDVGDVIGVGTPVYDYLREVQEILANEKTQKILEYLGIKTSDLNKVMAKLPIKTREKLEKKKEALNKVTKEINTTEQIMDNDKIFGKRPIDREIEKYDAEKQKANTPLSNEEKYEALQKEYQRIIEVVKKNRDDVTNQYYALNEIIELNSQVIGEQQAVELNTRAKAIQTEIQTRENIIMSQLVQLRAIKQRMKAANEETAREALLMFAESAKVADPFDEEERKEMERIGYKRHEVPDKMPSFDD